MVVVTPFDLLAGDLLDVLLKTCEILLRQLQVPCLEVLTQLLKLSLDLLKIGWLVLRTLSIVSRAGGEQIAAQDANDRHVFTSSLRETNGKVALLLKQAARQVRRLEHNI